MASVTHLGLTAGSGSVQAYAANDLPHIVRSLADGRSRVRVCQAAGDALCRALDLAAVELALCHGGREGVVFTTTAGDDLEPPDSVFASPSGAIRLYVTFADDDQRVLLEPVLYATLELLELGGELEEDAPVPRPLPATGPEPRTLDGRVEKIYDQARSIAAGDIGVLIRGASGSGKEVLAQLIHQASPRAGEVFLALNCAALPRDLLEAELFGVERGVATGVEARAGLFERAHGGTLLLDEIGDMAPDTQAKILRVMQEREVSRLGGARPRPADARIVAATNRDLEALLEAGSFRGDLYHRLAGWEVTLPSLAERRADVPNLAAHFLDREMRRLGLRPCGISRSALRSLTACPWPGNVRQLERQMVRAALFLGDREPLADVDLHCGGRQEPPPERLEAYLDGVERRAIRQTLDRCGGDVERAAEQLRIGRSTLYRRLKQLGVAGA